MGCLRQTSVGAACARTYNCVCGSHQFAGLWVLLDPLSVSDMCALAAYDCGVSFVGGARCSFTEDVGAIRLGSLAWCWYVRGSEVRFVCGSVIIRQVFDGFMINSLVCEIKEYYHVWFYCQRSLRRED